METPIDDTDTRQSRCPDDVQINSSLSSEKEHCGEYHMVCGWVHLPY